MGIMQSELLGGLYIGRTWTVEPIMAYEFQIWLYYLDFSRLQKLFREILRTTLSWVRASQFLESNRQKRNSVPEPKCREIGHAVQKSLR